MTQSISTNIPLNMAQEPLVKKIALYDQEVGYEILVNAQLKEGSVSDDKKFMEHPIEDGTVIIDHVVDDAKTGTVQVLISDDDAYSLDELMDFYQNSYKVVLKIKNEVFTDLVIASKPLKANAEYFDTTVYDLTFKEVMQAQTQYVKMQVPAVKNKKNASTVKTGQKQPTPSISRKMADWMLGRK